MDILGLIALARSKGGGGGSGSGTFVPSFGTLATIQTGVSWFGDDPYTLTVLVSGYTVTSNTMISVLPSINVVEQMMADGVSNIFITNNNGVLTATAVGGAPSAAMTLQVLCSESDQVESISALPGIVGDGVLETLQAANLTDAINQLSSDLDDAKNAISQNTEAISELDGVAYSAGDSLKVGRSLNGYILNSNGYLAGGNDYNVSFYRVVPGETIYLKLSQDTDTVYNFQTTDANPTASSGNIVENVHSAVDDFVKVPDGANFIAVCKLKTNTTNAICSTISSQTGIMEEVKTLFDVQEIVYASADLTTSSYLTGGHFDKKIAFSYIPVTDAGLLKVTWRDNRHNESSTVNVTFVVCKLIGSSYQIVATFSAPSISGRTNVYQSDYYVDGNDTYYVGIYGIHASNMSKYVYGWGLSSQTFNTEDDITVGTEFTRGNNYTDQSLAMYPSIISTNRGIREEIAEINDKISGNMAKEDEKYVHFSIDDCLFWTNLIDNEATYNSAFEEPHLALYKSIHELYGLCITLNVFCTSGNYSISDVPSKFATEFKANSNWLKFAYHAEDENTYLSNLTAAEAVESYNKFASAIYKMTGTTDCIDRVTRLGFYDGNLENCLAIRDANCGIVGLLCADDTRNSYYLGETLSAYVRNHAMYRDATNQIVFITTIRRLEYYSVTDAAELLTVAKGNINRYLEFFTHESSSDRLSAMVAWCVTNGYKFGFMQEILRI